MTKTTVGTQYLEAQKNDAKGLTIGEVGSEMVKGLIDDLNDVIESDPFSGRSFFINVVEERDLQMPNAIKRRLFVTKYRPYPEDNTLVFFVDQKEEKVCYCWDLPHHSEFPNILSNELLYDQSYVSMIKDWLRNDLSRFGFIKASMDSSHVEGYDEKTVNAYRQAYASYLDSMFDDQKSIESEKRLGYFWIPNKFHKDAPLEKSKPTILLS